MRLDIELERPTGIFYAGEVVRGTVRLDCDDEIKCRGFFLRFRGKAHVHWHTGSGDSRTDYDGNTLFQDQRQTLLGSLYKTALIDEAGADALFDRVHNSGIVNIPCDMAEESNLKLAIRVMDYDFGRRDDLLGEILLDVPSLVRSKQKQSFPLTRFGKQGVGEINLSASFVPYDAIFPSKSRSGLQVSAVVSKPLCLVLRVHQATGLRKADFVGRNDVYIQIYRLDNECEVGKGLPKPEIKTVIPAGTLIVPFAFQLMRDTPGSAELGVGDRSYVRYSIRANVDKSFWKDPSAKRLINVIPNRPLPSLQLLAPYNTETVDEPIFKCSCCCFRCCRLDGFVSAKLRIGRLAYAPGELVDLNESVAENSTSRDLPLEIVLTNHVIMSTGTASTSRHQRDYSLLRSTIGARQTVRIGDIAGADSVRVPAIFPSFYGGLRGEQTRFDRSYYPCLKWSYTLELRIGGNACQSIVATRAPVLICSASPYANSIERARSEASALSSLVDPFQIFMYAITGPEFCDTAPTISGPEDGGVAAAATDVGSVSIWEDAEDNNFVQDADSLTFQPIVNTFSQPSTPFGSAFATSGTQSTATNADAPSHANQVKALLASLDTSFDCRRTVGEWVRANPRTAARLSPEDVRSILSKVTFSLEQQSVIGELLSAFELGGSLTCAHVVAAMEICTYQKADVAKLMAPHVVDPENKQLVLDKMDFDFERQTITQAFR